MKEMPRTIKVKLSVSLASTAILGIEPEELCGQKFRSGYANPVFDIFESGARKIGLNGLTYSMVADWAYLEKREEDADDGNTIQPAGELVPVRKIIYRCFSL